MIMDMSKVAVQMYSFRDYCKTPEDLDNTLARLKLMGYRAVQISGVACSKEVIAEKCAKHDMKICATHIDINLLRNNPDEVANIHKLYDCKYVGLGAMPNESRKSKESYLAFADEFTQIAETLQKCNLYFMYHNHHFEFTKFGNETGMELLFKKTSPAFHFCIDTYWVQTGGCDPVEWINKVADRMKVVHLKDYAVNLEEKPEYAAIGEGNFDWKKIINACEKNGVEWYCIEQDDCPRDPFDCFASSFKYLEQLKL